MTLKPLSDCSRSLPIGGRGSSLRPHAPNVRIWGARIPSGAPGSPRGAPTAKHKSNCVCIYVYVHRCEYVYICMSPSTFYFYLTNYLPTYLSIYSFTYLPINLYFFISIRGFTVYIQGHHKTHSHEQTPQQPNQPKIVPAVPHSPTKIVESARVTTVIVPLRWYGGESRLVHWQ